MRIREVDFPDVLLEAQRSGRFVIFAGAGASIDPPSNYPDFKALAQQVGGVTHPREPGEAIDRYLGRLDSAGVTVHQQVCRILSSPDSKPNEVHNALTSLFKDPGTLRIVTTNFDRHFTTTIEQQFGAGAAEVFYAPALPVGNDFTGLIYLHGSVDKPPQRLVLTDSDFGRAYITEGWATRFLERLFSGYLVLFVGYSHEDPLLSYLARGLTVGSGPGRFVLTPPDEDAKWKNLGIQPIHYPRAAEGDGAHREFPIALAAWVERSQAGALAVEERIRTIVTGGMPLTLEDEDYLKHSLSELSTLRLFTRHARGIQWLQWVEHQPAFARIFITQSDYSDRDDELARWFTCEFVLDHADEVFDILRRKGAMSPLLWHKISLVLFKGGPHGELLSKWVSLLLTTAASGYRSDPLEYVLAHCKYPDDVLSALLLFDYLTRPALRLKESFNWKTENAEPATVIDIDLNSVAGREYWLEMSMNAFFLPNIHSLAKRLVPTITANLTAARRLTESFGKAGETWDRLSFSRGMIESRQQDHLFNSLSILIDAGAAVITWASEHDSKWLDAIINEWLVSESPLLRRLAIFGMSVAPTAPDNKLQWLTGSGLLYTFGDKHEVFGVIQKAYPLASLEVRKGFLKALEEQYPREERRKYNEGTADYELFNLAVWLTKAAPNCNLAADFRARLKEKNPDYGEREHPDMDSWIGPVTSIHLQSPVEPADLARYDVAQLVKTLEAAPETDLPVPYSREGLILAIGRQARTSHQWGFEIARQGIDRSVWSEGIWQPLISAWGATELTDDEWSTVFDILSASGPVYQITLGPITSLLDRGASNATAPIPTSLFDKAKLIADDVWIQCDKSHPEPVIREVDWFFNAINHPAGRLVDFYLNCLSSLQREKKLTQEIFRKYTVVFEMMIEGESNAALLARVDVTSGSNFLFHIDKDWTEKHVFPLLDPRVDEGRAKQCWHGFLGGGRWTDSMLADLIPLYEAMSPLIDDEKDEIRRRFCRHLAEIAVYSPIHPLEQGWLFRFLLVVSAETRAMWCGELHSHIARLDDDAKVHVWHRWLKAYWEERLQGRPLPLSPKETAEMLSWVLNLGPVLPEAVALILQSPQPDLGNSMIYYQIAESELLLKFPDPFVDLVLFLASGERGRPIYDLDRLRSAVEQLVTATSRNPRLRRVCDELVRLGVSDVAALAGRLEKH